MKTKLMCGCALGLAALSPSAATACADLALVLAIDGSSSVDAAEYQLQSEGFAAAFRDQRVKEALAQAGDVAVAAVFWGDNAAPRQILDWSAIDRGIGADAFAESLLGQVRTAHGNTGLGRGIGAALDLLEARCPVRAVINVSGDGRETREPSYRAQVNMEAVRDRANRMGVVINGLAIETDDPGLADYYRETVMTGPGAFVMSVRSFDDFADAILQKLTREIRPPLVADLANEVALR